MKTRKKEIAYLGPEGTFSYLLARRRFGEGSPLLACSNFDAIFEALLEKENRRALVPVENSSGGIISDVIDLLIENEEKIRITEELVLDVRPALLGKKKRKIRTIHSHFVPLRHYRHWIREMYPEAEIHAVSSTTQAVQDAKKDPYGAAIAAPGAAKLYGLDVLRFPLLPGVANITHFYVVDRQDSVPTRPRKAKHFKTALVAALKNDQCGILYKLLGPFARTQVNLKRIVSRPVPGRPETYVFFIEIDGSVEDPLVARAIRQAEKYCERLENLGSYPAGKKFLS